MSKGLIVLSGTLIGLAATGLCQEDIRSASGLDAIVARQAPRYVLITFRSMGDAMKAGPEAKSVGYPAAALAKWAKALPRMFPPGTGKGENACLFAGTAHNLARPCRL